MRLKQESQVLLLPSVQEFFDLFVRSLDGLRCPGVSSPAFRAWVLLNLFPAFFVFVMGVWRYCFDDDDLDAGELAAVFVDDIVRSHIAIPKDLGVNKCAFRERLRDWSYSHCALLPL